MSRRNGGHDPPIYDAVGHEIRVGRDAWYHCGPSRPDCPVIAALIDEESLGGQFPERRACQLGHTADSPHRSEEAPA